MKNNRTRQAMIGRTDWEIDMIDLIGQLFAQSRTLAFLPSNSAEWCANPAIADELTATIPRKKASRKSFPSVSS